MSGPSAALPAPDMAVQRRPHRALVNAASARYRPAGRFAYHFARGKLGIDLPRLGVPPRRARLRRLHGLEPMPTEGGPPFANILLIARVPETGAALCP